jgi:hypothetical protein
MQRTRHPVALLLVMEVAHPALQPAMPHVVDAGEALTPEAHGHTMHTCSPGQRVPLRAAARHAPEELVADVEQAAAAPRRSRREARGRAARRLGYDSDGDVGEQATQSLRGRRRCASAGGEGGRGRARRRLIRHRR